MYRSKQSNRPFPLSIVTTYFVYLLSVISKTLGNSTTTNSKWRLPKGYKNFRPVIYYWMDCSRTNCVDRFSLTDATLVSVGELTYKNWRNQSIYNIIASISGVSRYARRVNKVVCFSRPVVHHRPNWIEIVIRLCVCMNQTGSTKPCRDTNTLTSDWYSYISLLTCSTGLKGKKYMGKSDHLSK